MFIYCLSFFVFFFFLMIRLPPSSTLFPYTTLFRSVIVVDDHVSPAAAWVLLEELKDITSKPVRDRKSTRLNSSHRCISYAVFCLKKKKNISLPDTFCTSLNYLDSPLLTTTPFITSF